MNIGTRSVLQSIASGSMTFAFVALAALALLAIVILGTVFLVVRRAQSEDMPKIADSLASIVTALTGGRGYLPRVVTPSFRASDRGSGASPGATASTNRETAIVRAGEEN